MKQCQKIVSIEKARGRRVYGIDAKKPAENIFPENESIEMLPKVPKPSRKKAVVRGQHQNAQKLPYKNAVQSTAKKNAFKKLPFI